MNRLHRYFSIPTLFASIAVSAVIVLGEPINASAAEDPLLRLQSPAPSVELIEVNSDADEALRRAEQASRMRRLITLPHSRNGGCCRSPV